MEFKLTKEQTVLKLLQEQFPSYSKEKLEALIACRQIKIGNESVVNLNQLFPSESIITIVESKYVSRGGEKLEFALKEFNLKVDSLIMLDAGSSTGGFTDSLLQHGSKLVHAVDVGYNQLDYKLRIDNRVIVHERTNIMKVTTLEPKVDAAVADLSFRSITKAASHILSLTKQRWMVALIKPQFEVAKNATDFFGVIENKSLLKDVLIQVYKQLLKEGVFIDSFIESPIKGRKGNREYLALLNDQKKGISEEKFLSLIENLTFD